MSDLNSINEVLVKYGLSRGADQIEIFTVNERKVSIQQHGERTGFNSSIVAGIGIRAAISKKWGFTCSSSLDLNNAKTEIDQAIKIAKISEDDPDFAGFPSQPSLPAIPELVNQKLKNIQIEEIVAALIDARTNALDVNKNLTNVNGSFQVAVSNRAIANSSGLDVSYEKTSYSAGFAAVGTYGDHRHSETSFTGGTRYDLNLKPLAEDAARRTAEMLGPASKIEESQISLIMEPTSAAIFFIAATRLIFKGNLALSHRSQFQMKDLGTQIASPALTFIDDGTLKGGIKAAPVDDEGSASKRTALIDKGVLKNFLFDHSQARKAGVEPTGNAARGIGHSPRSYTNLPAIGSRDRIIRPGTKTQAELIAEVDNGLLIGYPAGIFLSNPMTTDFTIFPTRVLGIKNGEITGPVTGASMAGNAIQWLKKITAVGNDTITMESMTSPSILFNDIPVSAAEKKKSKPPMMG
ncbi:MAG: TldD/PmbA family protein [Candidatus Odinarchaeota archaeon]